MTGFPSASVLGWQSSRLPTDYMGMAEVSRRARGARTLSGRVGRPLCSGLPLSEPGVPLVAAPGSSSPRGRAGSALAVRSCWSVVWLAAVAAGVYEAVDGPVVDDRGQHAKLLPAAAGALHQLAAVTGSTSKTLAHALPVFTHFTGDPARPVRATAACQRCLAANGIHRPIPILLAAHLKICSRHQLWLPASGLPQLDLSACPDITSAQHQARRLLRRCTPQQLISAQVAAVEHITGPEPDPRPGPRTGNSASACSKPATPAPAAQRRPGTSSSPQRSTPTQSHSRPRSSPGYSTDTRPGERPSATPQTPAGRIRRDNRTSNPRQTVRRPGQTSRNSP